MVNSCQREILTCINDQGGQFSHDQHLEQLRLNFNRPYIKFSFKGDLAYKVVDTWDFCKMIARPIIYGMNMNHHRISDKYSPNKVCRNQKGL